MVIVNVFAGITTAANDGGELEAMNTGDGLVCCNKGSGADMLADNGGGGGEGGGDGGGGGSVSTALSIII